MTTPVLPLSSQAEKLRLLIDGVPVAVVSTLILAALTVAITASVNSPAAVAGWAAALVSITAARAWRWWKPRDHLLANVTRESRLFRLGCLAAGMTWGAAGVVLFPADDVVNQAFLSFVIAGVSAGAITTLAAQRDCAVAFVVPAVTPLAINLLAQGGRFGVAMGLMVVLYLTVILLSARRVAAQVSQNIDLRMQAGERERAQHRAEAALRAAHRQMASVIDSATHVAIISLDTDGLITTFNSGAERLLGYSADELLHRQTARVFIDPELLDLAADELSAATGTRRSGLDALLLKARDNDSYRCEARYVCKNGASIYVDLIVTAMRAGEGELTGFLAMAVDITEHHRALREIANARSQLATFIEHTPAAVAMFDREIRYLTHSQRWRTDYGLGTQVLIGRSHYEVFPEVPQTWKDIHQRCLAGNIERREEDPFLRADGEVQWLRWEVRPWRDEEGRIGGILMLTEVITERKRAAEQLQRLNERFELATRAAGMGVWDWNIAADQLIWDDRMYEILRLPRGTPLHPTDAWQGVVHTDDVERVRREIAAARADAATFGTTFRIVGASERTITLAGLVSRAAQKAVRITGLCWDITESRRVELLKNEFVATVSHELRTPLTSIRGSLGLVAGGAAGPLPPKATSLVAMAVKNCERLMLLINDILDIERIESGQLGFIIKACALAALLERAVEDSTGYAQNLGVRFTLRRPLTAATVAVDESRILQVMANLLSNAAKFSPRGGTVEISAAQHKGHVRVEVRDQGAGIPPEFHSRIFQKFSQADSSDSRARGGTGLGLAISKAIIERHSGRIGFESAAGRGTIFYFELPLPTEQAPAYTAYFTA